MIRTLSLLSKALHPQSRTCIPVPCDIQASIVGMQLASTIDDAHAAHVYSPSKEKTNQQHIAQLTELLQEYACYGIQHLQLIAHKDPIEGLIALAKTTQFEYLICGTRSGEYASGIVPYVLAKACNLTLIEQVYAIKGGALLQYLPSGNRRQIPLPKRAILVIHPQAKFRASYAYTKGTQCNITQSTLTNGVNTKQNETTPQLSSILRPKQNYHASISIANKTRGMQRLQQIINEENTKGEVIHTGTPKEHAEQILRILEDKNLLKKDSSL